MSENVSPSNGNARRPEDTPESKYYDPDLDRPIQPEEDGCDFVVWDQRYPEARVARHKGFLVFLPPSKIQPSDEYLNADPYGVAESIKTEFQRRRIDLTVELLKEAIGGSTRSPRILDLGCGKGYLTEEIRRRFPESEMSGCDYALTAIAVAAKQFPEIDFAVADASHCPYAPGYFDAVVCNNLWEHVPDPLRMLGRIHDTLRPGGHLVISTPSRYRLPNLFAVLFGKRIPLISPHHVTEYTVGQVKEMLEFGGFDVVRVASRAIRPGSRKYRLAKALLSWWIRRTGSHHNLESTVFYLARRA
jgi:2-polyprenyl-3-methyl-5-hydroxy-6-metoxy-1,4-benzoquinol methylase